MIYSDKTIIIKNGIAYINEPIVIYKGDKDFEVRFSILKNPYKYSTDDGSSVPYAQLVIKGENDIPPVFSDITAIDKNVIIFIITEDMINKLEVIGYYDFQIRLLNEDQKSRITIPPIVCGIEIREPIDFIETEEVVEEPGAEEQVPEEPGVKNE